MNIPISYNQITVEQYMFCHAIVKNDEQKIDKQIQLISYFNNKSTRDVEDMAVTEFKELCELIEYLFTDIPPMPIPKRVGSMLGLQLKPTLSLDKFSTAQMVDFYETLRGANNSIPQCLNELLAIIYTKNGTYVVDEHAEHAKWFKKQKLKNVIGAVFFYTDFSLNAEKAMVNYLRRLLKENKKIITDTTSSREFQDFLSSGVGNTA